MNIEVKISEKDDKIPGLAIVNRLLKISKPSTPPVVGAFVNSIAVDNQIVRVVHRMSTSQNIR